MECATIDVLPSSTTPTSKFSPALEKNTTTDLLISAGDWVDAEADWLCEAVSEDVEADADDAPADPDEEPPEQPARAIAPAVAPIAAAPLTNERREIIDITVSSFGAITLKSIVLSPNALKVTYPFSTLSHLQIA